MAETILYRYSSGKTIMCLCVCVCVYNMYITIMFMALFISYIIYVEYLLNDYRVTLCFPRKTFEFHTIYNIYI